jgi:hypothetical protein
MKIEFVTKKHIVTEEKVEMELPILEKVTYLHYKYSGGYNYFVKFMPSKHEYNNNKFYTLDFIYMPEEKIVKGQIKINPLDFHPSLSFDPEREEFDYIGQKQNNISQDYLSIIATYWLLQGRSGDCFFRVITEEQFNDAKQRFFNNESFFGCDY